MADFSLLDLPEHYHSLKDSSIIIIGNGPSAAEYDLGNEIDKFDQVVRINNYITTDLEAQVGGKTDIWVNGANQGLKSRKTLANNILVMIPSLVLDHKGESIHKRIQQRLGTDHYYMLPVDLMRKIESQCEIVRPTTGFFTIYFFYLLGFDVTLHGFDFFVGSTSHYFDSPFKRWLKDKGLIRKAGKHDVSGEKSFIEALIESGKIKLLKP